MQSSWLFGGKKPRTGSFFLRLFVLDKARLAFDQVCVRLPSASVMSRDAPQEPSPTDLILQRGMVLEPSAVLEQADRAMAILDGILGKEAVGGTKSVRSSRHSQNDEADLALSAAPTARVSPCPAPFVQLLQALGQNQRTNQHDWAENAFSPGIAGPADTTPPRHDDIYLVTLSPSEAATLAADKQSRLLLQVSSPGPRPPAINASDTGHESPCRGEFLRCQSGLRREGLLSACDETLAKHHARSNSVSPLLHPRATADFAPLPKRNVPNDLLHRPADRHGPEVIEGILASEALWEQRLRHSGIYTLQTAFMSWKFLRRRREMEESIRHSSSSATKIIVFLSCVALVTCGAAGVSGLASAGVQGGGSSGKADLTDKVRGREGDLQVLYRLLLWLAEVICGHLVRLFDSLLAILQRSEAVAPVISSWISTAREKHAGDGGARWNAPSLLEPFDMRRPPLADAMRPAAVLVGDYRRRFGAIAAGAAGVARGFESGSGNEVWHEGDQGASAWAGGPVVALSAATLVGEASLRVTPRLARRASEVGRARALWGWWRGEAARQGRGGGSREDQVGSASLYFRDDRFFGAVQPGHASKACVDAHALRACVKRDGPLLPCWEGLWNAAGAAADAASRDAAGVGDESGWASGQGARSSARPNRACSAVLRRYHQWELEDVFAPGDAREGADASAAAARTHRWGFGLQIRDALARLRRHSLESYIPIFAGMGRRGAAPGFLGSWAGDDGSDDATGGHFLGVRRGTFLDGFVLNPQVARLQPGTGPVVLLVLLGFTLPDRALVDQPVFCASARVPSRRTLACPCAQPSAPSHDRKPNLAMMAMRRRTGGASPAQRSTSSASRTTCLSMLRPSRPAPTPLAPLPVVLPGRKRAIGPALTAWRILSVVTPSKRQRMHLR